MDAELDNRLVDTQSNTYDLVQTDEVYTYTHYPTAVNICVGIEVYVYN